MLTKFIKAVIGGICIGIGGAAYVSVGNPIVGSLIFSIGLLLICMNGFKLFTGMIPYAKPEINYVVKNVTVLLGNIVGAWIVGFIFYLSKPDLYNTTANLCFKKLDEGWRIMPLAFMCNVLIFFAVDLFGKYKLHYFVRVFVIVMCVMVFILCGYEHCIANVFYFSAAQIFDAKVFAYLLLNIIFNGIGGICIYRLVRFAKRDGI